LLCLLESGVARRRLPNAASLSKTEIRLQQRNVHKYAVSSVFF